MAALTAGPPHGVLHTEHRCVSFKQDDRCAVVTFDNGVIVEADVVIAADGIHSTLQRYVVEPCPPVFSGVVAYRGVMPAARVPNWSWPHALANWGAMANTSWCSPCARAHCSIMWDLSSRRTDA